MTGVLKGSELKSEYRWLQALTRASRVNGSSCVSNIQVAVHLACARLDELLALMDETRL